MPDEEKSAPDQKKEAIAAWHDAKTLDDKRAVVAKFPILRELYSEAKHLN